MIFGSSDTVTVATVPFRSTSKELRFGSIATTTMSAVWLLLSSTGYCQEFAPLVSVAPATAEVGVVRNLSISGTWPNACIPTGATVLPAVADINAISIRLIEGAQTAGCQAGAPRNYTVNAAYTPIATGVQKVIVGLASGAMIGQGNLITMPSGQTRSVQDLSGAWSDPSKTGSGLAISHSHAGSDLLAGSLYIYNANGFPTWHLLQNSRWQSPTKLKADIVYHRAGTAQCNTAAFLALAGCPKPSIDSSSYGIVDIELLPNGQIQLDAFTRPGPTDFSFRPLFSMTMSRLLF